MQESRRDAHKQDRALRALEFAAISGFMDSVWSPQASCLRLCNTFRENVPVQHLWISEGVPPSILANVYPSLRQAEAEDSSTRVLAHRRVRRVHWGLVDTSRKRRIAEVEEEHHEEARGEGRNAGAREPGHEADRTVDISKVRWPEETSEIVLWSFDQHVLAVTWPDDLKRLFFGQPLLPISVLARIPDMFNMPLDGAAFPACLREILLGDCFDQPIEGVAWPGGLERLSLPGFNQSIRDVQWPPGLKALEFVSPSAIQRWKGNGEDGHRVRANRKSIKDSRHGHGSFNQPLGTTLPQSLETLYLSEAFDQPLDRVSWPRGIVTLGLAFDFRHYQFSGSVTWPSNLRDLFVVSKPREGMGFPQGSKVTRLITLQGGDCSGSRRFGIEYYNRGEDPSTSRNVLGGYDVDVDLFDECLNAMLSA